MILILASVSYPSYEPTEWQGTLITMAVALGATAFNIWGAKKLPLFEGIILFFHILGFFAIIIPLLALAPKAPASEVFGSFANYGGWSSTGAACVIGQLAAAGAFIGTSLRWTDNTQRICQQAGQTSLLGIAATAV